MNDIRLYILIICYKKVVHTSEKASEAISEASIEASTEASSEKVVEAVAETSASKETTETITVEAVANASTNTETVQTSTSGTLTGQTGPNGWPVIEYNESVSNVMDLVLRGVQILIILRNFQI
ncbi:MAG: hypothetical protein IJR29_09455 [Butyrivibrio sp.]|nr:hypothetical protein [Butyrivibrio sp.]